MVNLRQIEAFKAVIEQKTVTRAAETLHISQPAVSRLISDLEYYVGFKLFVRNKRQLIPTPEAHGLFKEVERSYFGLERIIEAARDIREFKGERLFICSMPALSLSLLPRVFRDFTKWYPDIAVSLQVHSSQRVMEWVASQQCDLGFIGMNIDDPAVKQVRLGTGVLKLVMRPEHQLADRKCLTPHDLAGQPLIFLGQQLDFRPQVEYAFKEAGVDMNVRIETQLSSVACEFAIEGTGVSLVDPITASTYAQRGLAVRDFKPVVTQAWDALLPGFRPVSRLTMEFIDATRSTLTDILNNAKALEKVHNMNE